MRRPLFMVCLFLVIMTGCIVKDCDWKGLDDMSCIVTGQVYQKDTDCFYLESVVIKEADVSQTNFNSSISEQGAAIQQQEIPFTEKLICEYDGQTEVLIGSTVQLAGTFCAFLEATNSGEFDMAGYYHSLQIGGKVKAVTVLWTSKEYSEWREMLFHIRGYFQARLYEIFPEKEASVMCAMLLGDKKNLDKDVKDLYQDSGIIHILSISGLHITIIGMSVYRLLRKLGLPVWLAALCGGGILLIYGFLTGMSVSAYRAMGMYLLRMLSEVVGRTYDMLTALGLMAVIVVWTNPGYLQNAGFYLSFGAVLGIGVLYPALLPIQRKKTMIKYEGRGWKLIINKTLKQLGDGLRQSILMGVSVTVTTLPLQLWFYYEISTYSIIINLFVLPWMSLVMVCGLWAMLIPGVGFIGTIDCLILSGYELICKLFEKLPFSTWNPGRPEVWKMVIYYLLLLGVVGMRYRKDIQENHTDYNRYGLNVLRLTQIVGLTIAVVLLGLPIHKKTTITFLDVGQGDCICMQLASGQVYLFDCGSSSRSRVGEYVLKPYLKYYGISYIDAVFVSHPDKDHSSGVLELLHNGDEWGITVGQLVLPDLEPLTRREDLSDFLQTAKRIPVISAKVGDFWEVGDNRFVCLHPPAACDLEDTNAYSQCFYMAFGGGQSVLLTGDVVGEGEEMLLAELKRRHIDGITLLKVAHHGSKFSTTEALLEQLQPQLGVISCGQNNSYGHPHEETLERLTEVGSKIVATAEGGQITVEIVEQGIWVEEYKDKRVYIGKYD